jgi:hypothetical protein
MSSIPIVEAFLDGQPIVIGRPTLAAALAAGVEAAEARGRIIVEAVADGRPLDDNALDQPSDSPGDVREVRLVSAEPRALVRVTFLDAADALDDAKNDQARAAEMVQVGHLSEAMKPLQSALATWQTVRDVVDRGSAVLKIDLKNPGVAGGVSVEDRTSELLSRLNEIKSAITREDWSALSDILAYDLGEQIDAWKGMLRGLADHVMAMPRFDGGRQAGSTNGGAHANESGGGRA